MKLAHKHINIIINLLIIILEIIGFVLVFKEMGITNFKKQEQGTIDIYTYGDSGLRVAVEFCGDTKKKVEKKSRVGSMFDLLTFTNI